MDYSVFDVYVKEKEPTKYHKSNSWKTAIGLQKVDNLTTSDYLIQTAILNINGDITFEEANDMINSYYKSKQQLDDRCEEADKVSVRIAQILSEQSFVFSPVYYQGIHKRLFEGIFEIAGKIRDYNISKEEWVLNGDTVIYGSCINLYETLEYDFNVERGFNYKGLSINEIITHIARFIANLWQIHPFGEGNTRTTAVFLIKYLNKLGFNASNDAFLENSWYFRNALVRANYTNIPMNIFETTYYLELFLRNLLLGENNKLSNREMFILNNIDNLKLNDSVMLTNNEVKVLNILKDNSKITLDEVANVVGKSLRTVKSIVKRLEEKALVKRIGGKRFGYWEVK